MTDPESDDEINGGILVVWAPDDQQDFPTGFGEDGKLFTDDDPTASIPAGYNLVDMNAEPFQFTKQAQPEITLNEGEVAVNDFTDLSYTDAFEALFEKASREYPFTQEKDIDWQALHDEFAPRVAQAQNDTDFYRVLHDFTRRFQTHMSDSRSTPRSSSRTRRQFRNGFGRIERRARYRYASRARHARLRTRAFSRAPRLRSGPGRSLPGDRSGDSVPGAVLHANARTVGAAVSFLTRVPPGESVTFSYQNPDASEPQAGHSAIRAGVRFALPGDPILQPGRTGAAD